MASDLIERLTKERDEAQPACTAWQGIYEGLEAHLMDRVNMGDEANPEAYLSILRGYVADIIRDSRAICNARWADYGRHEAALAIERERAEKAEALADRLKLEAQIHAGEARCANDTINQAYRAVTGGTGEPGNWHGAEPIKQSIGRDPRLPCRGKAAA